MTITKDRKRLFASDIFPEIEDFINYLKNDYNNINFENENIKSSIIRIYNKLINDDGNVKILRMSRWLHNQFGFKHSNKFSLPFWIERGLTKEDYEEYSKPIFEKRSKRLKEYSKKLKEDSYIYDDNYSNIYVFNTTMYKSEIKPKCNLCDSDILFKKSTKEDKKVYLIERCLNDKCDTVDIRNQDIRRRAFLPDIEYRKIKEKLSSIKRSFSKEFWIERGYSKEEAILKVSEIQSENSKKFKGKRIGKSKENLRNKGYTEEEIKDICLSNRNWELWVKKGYTEEEAKEKVSEMQKHSSKFVDYDKRLLPSNVEYWLKRGYNEIESKQKVSESQRTFSKKICIDKYGYDEGLKVFNRRTRKWLDSLKNNDNIFIGYSKVSQELFSEINERMDGDFRYGENGGEFKLKRENGGYYFYDFTDVDNKLIIEYNGDMYHANPKIYEADDNPHPFRKDVRADEIWEKDKEKIKTVEEIGFKVLVIWDSEYRYKGKNNKELLIEKCINFLRENNTNNIN